MNNIDYISLLPFELLIKIISYLSLKDVKNFLISNKKLQLLDGSKELWTDILIKHHRVKKFTAYYISPDAIVIDLCRSKKNFTDDLTCDNLSYESHIIKAHHKCMEKCICKYLSK